MQTTSVDEDIRELLQESEEAAKEYLVVSFVSAAMEHLFHARRQARMSQEDLARRLGTKQPAVARWERDSRGSITLGNYARFLAECGFVPFDLELCPISKMRHYTLQWPSESRTVTSIDPQSLTIPQHSANSINWLPEKRSFEAPPSPLQSVSESWGRPGLQGDYLSHVDPVAPKGGSSNLFMLPSTTPNPANKSALICLGA